ncbi:hypothetical protein [Nitrobacter sp. TKz-YC02]|uniref:hypothetical protein n=1 Tax=Nitrobacter sp. TKz-YC02 TaxID=3398704 RepID=UPI003CED987A
MDHTPNLGSIIGGLGVLFWLIYGLNWIVREQRTRIRLEGIKEATSEIAFFVSHSYERPGEPLPEPVAKALDNLAHVRKLRTAQQRYEAYVRGIRMLGEAMGKAAKQRGYDEGFQAQRTDRL